MEATLVMLSGGCFIALIVLIMTIPDPDNHPWAIYSTLAAFATFLILAMLWNWLKTLKEKGEKE